VGTAGSTAQLLTEAEGRALLRLARLSLERQFDLGSAGPLSRGETGGSPASSPGADAEIDAARLSTEQRGVFVTLTNQGRLRGCVGYVEGARPLADLVPELAVSAALHDGRFEPVAGPEVATLHIEVSVLTPPHPLPQPIDPSDVEIGRHGLIARRGGRSGLLLPQVAPEWGWGPRELLDRTCEKAGLPRDAWTHPDCSVLAFEAQIFDE